ncbi:MAG: hypothetical protein OHK0050_40530 [Roseiflexaceae bacterium]
MNTEESVQVAIREEPPRLVVGLMCELDQATGQFSTQIGDGFALVKQWATQSGQQRDGQLLIGIPHVREQRLVAYDCTVMVIEPLAAIPAGFRTTELAGGRYAVLTMAKDSATIGAQIGWFFREYVPSHGLQIDTQRLSYEVYHATTMDYYAPIAA